MNRESIRPRNDWQTIIEEQGLVYHWNTVDSYWNESAYYRFSMEEALEIEAATAELYELCLQAVQHVIDAKRYEDLRIPELAIRAIEATWDAEPPSLYGRFDLAYDGTGPPKLLEFNADTPTALLEAAVIQWKWKEDVFPAADQFNSIWEALVEEWQELKRDRHLRGHMVHFAHCENLEDMMTVAVLQDTAQAAGVPQSALHMAQIGWDEQNRWFVDQNGMRIRTIFKLYPWEWMLDEPFAHQALETMNDVQWIEPIWKMILSNKGILAILWELFPNHPNLLPCYFDRSHDLAQHVRKPLSSRQGESVTIKVRDKIVRATADVEAQRWVYQDYSELPVFEGMRPVLGSWLINGAPRGMGIRESESLITDNLSCYVPHCIR